MTALLPVDGPVSFDGAVLIRHNNMAPEIKRGSAVFFMPLGYRGEGIYSFTDHNWHPGDLRRVSSGLGCLRLGIDSFPKHARWHDISREDFIKAGPRQVAGVIVPHTTEFEYFLASRFRMEGGR